MADDYIPKTDEELILFMNDHAAMMVAHGAALGFSPAEILEAQQDAALFTNAKLNRETTETAFRAAVQTLNLTRKDVVGRTRARSQRAMKHPAITPAIRAAGRLNEPDTVRTPFDKTMILSLPPPLAILDQSINGRIRIVWGTNPSDEAANPRPEGIVGVRIRFALGPNAPTSDAGWSFLVDDDRSPYVHVFAGSPPGFIWYQLAWLDRTMQVGAYGDPLRGNVTA